MKPVKNIEEFVKLEKPHVTTGGEMDKRTLNDSFAAMDETTRANKPSAAGVILRSRVARLAAAAVIILAVGLFLIQSGKNEKVEIIEVTKVTKTPGEMLTSTSLLNAYITGGIEAVDKQNRKAAQLLNRKPVNVSIRELLAESNSI